MSGLTVILDIIGPVRIREFAARVGRNENDVVKKFMNRVTSIGCFAVIAIDLLVGVLAFTHAPFADILIVASGVTVVFVILNTIEPLLKGLAKLFEQPNTETAIRWLAITLFIVGFHFTLLSF
jgi:hypothetical protein